MPVYWQMYRLKFDRKCSTLVVSTFPHRLINLDYKFLKGYISNPNKVLDFRITLNPTISYKQNSNRTSRCGAIWGYPKLHHWLRIWIIIGFEGFDKKCGCFVKIFGIWIAILTFCCNSWHFDKNFDVSVKIWHFDSFLEQFLYFG